MSVTTVAGRYARALFDAAGAQGLISRIDNDLALVARELAENKDFRILLQGRALSMAEKKTLLQATFSAALQPMALDFLCLVIDKEREAWLPDIIETYHQLNIAAQGIVQACLITPKPADAAFQAEVAKLLAADYGDKLEFLCETDPSLLGGALVKIRDQVIDLSLAKQFQMIRKEMLK